MMVIGGRDITSIPSEYFNPSHLGARNNVFSPDLNPTQLETPLQGRITQRETKVTRSNTRITNWSLLFPGPILRSDFLQSLVPVGSGSYPQIRLFAVHGSCWFRVLSSDQIPAVFGSAGSRSQPKASLYIFWPLLVSGLNCKACLYNCWIQYSQPGAVTTNIRINSTKVSRLITPPHRRKTRRLQVGHNIFRPRSQLIKLHKQGIKRLLVLVNFHWSCSAKTSLPKRREHGFSASCKGAEEKRELYIKTFSPSDSWVQLEQMRVKEAGEHTFQLLFISGLRVPDPRSRILGPGSRSRVSDYPPYMEVKSNGSTKKKAPTTLLPLFPATNPDIPLKEIKAFYPLQTPGETQDPCLSKSPRRHPSTSCKKWKFPMKESRIRQSTRK
ncbi:hypothetical protein HID58_034139 [Brassica napus]|uniref:Uncharacterized protein n=1 Tax=Brassica napus TaxID=3708 RepID=A0ABQ8C1G2_BRANA|nr:hypothetical protein HID58_034139 [Brassica napus]